MREIVFSTAAEIFADGTFRIRFVTQGGRNAYKYRLERLQGRS
jgi:hypothetical protein